MEHAEILHRCFRCGYCKLPSDYTDLNCPSYLKFRFETYSPGGRMWLLRAWLNQEIETSSRLSEILFSCAACGNCVEHCVFPEFKSDLLDIFISGREELVNEGVVPPSVRDYFKAMIVYGNPYKLPEAERGAWTEGLGIEPYKDQECLFFVGCAGAYDERGQKMTRAVASILKNWGVSFGVLGADECCDGNEVKTLGETGLFDELAKKNIKAFEDAGVKKIITLSPHGYHAIKNEYPKFGGNFEVRHYSQVLADLMEKERKYENNIPLKVTFHDPCYLGRHNWEYQAPRTVLQTLPGIEFKEMDRIKADALCCGGGGGNFYTDVLGGGFESPARVRVREAFETGAEVLAAACPKCVKMFEDAIKAEELEDRMQVMDLAEIVQTRLE
ncbi:MAG: (Fe-S)-binding protein [Deltaproteobacteria bacterium]|nr:(Fe-S)-binding protein [Deltaproteobacteria bacterium]MBW2053682.1 (Fe-S)-binding protein [Deltaproteobacteria bacterium]MBW2142059.1 (Fe-S)-binding protein [Deltaproteobacteria bacterium]